MARFRRNLEILLLQDSESLGEVGEVVGVRPGYARNYLFPSGIACPVTKDAMQRVERAKKQATLQRAQRAAKVAHLAKALDGLSLTLEERASEEGHLFGSVSATTIREALLAQGLKIEEKQIQLEAHIKELGIFNVPVRLDPEHTVALRIWVVEPGV